MNCPANRKKANTPAPIHLGRLPVASFLWRTEAKADKTVLDLDIIPVVSDKLHCNSFCRQTKSDLSGRKTKVKIENIEISKCLNPKHRARQFCLALGTTWLSMFMWERFTGSSGIASPHLSQKERYVPRDVQLILPEREKEAT